MDLYERVADLPLRVEETGLERRERATSSGFDRVSTVVELRGDGATGRGEDVTYDAPDHEAFHDAGLPDLAGEYTFSEFSAALDDAVLFPDPPERQSARHYRRWALESAALDLALRQAGTDLGAVLDREYQPVHFVTSARLGDPPTAERVHALREAYPDVAFKLDATPAWDADLIADLAATGAVRIVDLKAHYEGTEVDAAPDPALYRRVLEGFPEAVVEDPGFTDETEALLRGEAERLAWDAPVTGVESLESLPVEPRWVNVKPSRFGTVRSLFAALSWCLERDVSLYGGGQFELDVGRAHVQALASLFYPDGPNDVAPGGYNDPEVRADLPTSPLAPGPPRGLDWRAE